MTKRRLILAFIAVVCLSSCNKFLGGFGGNPYSQGCKIKAEYGILETYDVSEYLRNIRTEIGEIIELPKDLNEILLAETFDGGNGVHDLKILLFNESEVIPVKIKYTFIGRKEVTKELSIGEISQREHKKIIEIHREIENYGKWNIFVECLSLTTEQGVIFYIKEGENYLYFAKFANFYFTENPSIGIDDNILYLIDRLMKI